MCTSARKKDLTKLQLFGKVAKKSLWGLLKCLIVTVHWFFDKFLDFAFGLYYDDKARKVPPPKSALLLDSATTLAEKIRTKKVTSVEVVKTFIERCKEVDKIINAVVQEQYDNALSEAKKVDELLSSNRLDYETLKKTKPLLGVPFTTKDSNQVKGLSHSMALVFSLDVFSSEDAVVIWRVREAGGIFLGTTNIPELNMWCESRNNIYGQTNNPYNTVRTVGGSSGGDGAIVASCGVPFAIGSDLGGSIRMPAFFNGVFGHKPSSGLIPLKGVGCRMEDFTDSIVEAGPICRKAEDLAPLMKVICGPKASSLKLDEPVNLKTLNIFYQENSGDLRASRVSSSVRGALLKAVNHFKGISGSATKIKVPGTEYSYKIWRYWVSQEKFSFSEEIARRRGLSSISTEIVRYFCGKSDLTLASIIKLTDDAYLPKEDAKWAKEATAKMKNFLLEKLGDNGVFFYPPGPFTAIYHYATYLRPFNFGYFVLGNILKFPVCEIPLGLDEKGLPLGVQVIAAPNNDRLCFAVARELEAAFRGWVSPS